MGYESDISTQMLAIRCTFCGKPLRVPESIERGYGPDCDAEYMGGMGEAMVAAQMEQLFDPGEAEAAMKEAPDIAPTGWIEPTEIATKGQIIEVDGEQVKAKGGEIVRSIPLNPGSLREYWERKGGGADDPHAPWRRDPEVRRQMVSYGIWYASRAATFGYSGAEVTADKVDPRWLVIAAVQRFARAVGLSNAANAIGNFYAARVVKVVKARVARIEEEFRDAIIFETDVPPGYRLYRRTAGPGVMRVHAPYNPEFNTLARTNSDVFFAWDKDPPYYWRFFHRDHLRKVINILQQAYGDRPSLTRKYIEPDVRRRQLAEERRQVKVVDTFTGEVRLFPPDIARRLLTEQPETKYKSRRRYQEIK
jgi:hypothetical protein